MACGISLLYKLLNRYHIEPGIKHPCIGRSTAKRQRFSPSLLLWTLHISDVTPLGGDMAKQLPPRNITVLYIKPPRPGAEPDKPLTVVATWTDLGIRVATLYKMVESAISLREPQVGLQQGPGPHRPPGTDTWYIAEEDTPNIHLVPHAQAPVQAGTYQIFALDTLELFVRPGLQDLNWDKNGRTKRKYKWADKIRKVYTRCAITEKPAWSDGVDTLQAAHICPASTVIAAWDYHISRTFEPQPGVQMTKEFLQSEWNGVLLRADLHVAFDRFAISVIRTPWKWTVVAFHPSYAEHTGTPFEVRCPVDARDIQRLAHTFDLHFLYATQKFGGFESHV
ncbi:hypothetical protein OH77DRAFT_634774 [Trametes cingulata]|nr:hypothetical protein OH77DRAFT_634774 [Trametes cingulata]